MTFTVTSESLFASEAFTLQERSITETEPVIRELIFEKLRGIYENYAELADKDEIMLRHFEGARDLEEERRASQVDDSDW
jgi:hypothetical protein